MPLSNRAINLFGQILKNNKDGKIFRIKLINSDTSLRKYRDKVGIKDLHFHHIHHEAITRLSRKLGVLELARMVGNRNISQLMTYYNQTAESLVSKLG